MRGLSKAAGGAGPPGALPRIKQPAKMLPCSADGLLACHVDFAEGDNVMSSAKELRQHAAEFLKLAQSASGEGRACLLAIAKAWTRDAEDIERRNARRRERGTSDRDSNH